MNINFQKRFEVLFQKRCLRLFVAAYQIAREENAVKVDWNENDITQKLDDYMQVNSFREEWNISTHVESKIHNNEDIEEVKGFADKLPRIDLKFSSFTRWNFFGFISWNTPIEFIYFIEAKNLKEKSSQLKRRYIETGINSFTSKKYENGCLAGYLLKGDLELTIEGINSLLKKDKRNTEFLNFKKSDLHDFYYESEHIEIGILKHFIFDFTEK